MEFEINDKITKSQSSIKTIKDSHSRQSNNLKGEFQNPNPYAEDPFLSKNPSLIEVDEDNLPF